VARMDGDSWEKVFVARSVDLDAWQEVFVVRGDEIISSAGVKESDEGAFTGRVLVVS
jgi:hypothetical protein